MKEPDWTEFTNGITRLKIINNAITRLEPVRDTKSFEVLYWILDKGKENEVKLHTWQVLWISWNTRGTKLKGNSLVKPVVGMARLLEQIGKAVGINFKRWSDRKYFFVCGTEKRPWGKAHMANFLRDVKRMKEKNLSAIPVPAGFSVEDIGGEVFEGKAITDYIVTMIAVGMQYPKEFLESGRTQASDKAFLAWVVRYGRNQNLLRRAYEHQLWKRHLWCLYGKTQTIVKQGPKPKDAKSREIPTYVPKLIWKAEGKWAKETKMKTLKLVGDMANPADPPLHVALQKDMADTLGYGGLDWTDVDKFVEVRGKIKVIEAQRELMKVEALLKRDQELEKKGTLVKKVEADQKAKLEIQKQIPLKGKEEQLKEQQVKRLEAGVSVTKKPEKGKSKPMGGTRKVEETEIMIKPVEIPVKIRVVEDKEVTKEKKKTEDKKQKLIKKIEKQLEKEP